MSRKFTPNALHRAEGILCGYGILLPYGISILIPQGVKFVHETETKYDMDKISVKDDNFTLLYV